MEIYFFMCFNGFGENWKKVMVDKMRFIKYIFILIFIINKSFVVWLFIVFGIL